MRSVRLRLMLLLSSVVAVFLLGTWGWLAYQDQLARLWGATGLQVRLAGPLRGSPPGVEAAARAGSAESLIARVAQERVSTARGAALFTGFAILLLGIVSYYLYHWVSVPLQTLTMALEPGNAGLVNKLVKNRTEFGVLARLMRQFFEQERKLANEVAERKQAAAALRHAHEELEAVVADRTAELKKANSALVRKVDEHAQAETRIRDLNARLERRIHRIAAMRAVDMAITASLDPRVTLDVVLDQAAAHLGAEAAGILLLNEATQALEYTTGRGFLRRPGRQFPIGVGVAGQAFALKRIVSGAWFPSTGNGGAAWEPEAGADDIRCFAAPLIAKGQAKGVLEVCVRLPADHDGEWMEYLEALAAQAAVAIDNASLVESLQRSNAELLAAYGKTIEGWTRALDLRDHETEGHSRRVTDKTVDVAWELGIRGPDLMHVRWGALMHDIGKLAVPDSILLKPGKLTDDEWVVMRQHPTYAFEMLSPIAFLRPAIDIPYCHHEKWDGTGYPRGIRGAEIPLAARVFALADVWDALRSDRPYRRAWPDEQVLDHLRSLAGTHFDPEVAEAFLRSVAPPDVAVVRQAA